MFKIRKNILCTLILAALFLGGCQPQDVSSPTRQDGMRIHDIQGCSHRSPYAGRYVSGIEGIVTKKIDTGFYIQDELPDNQECSSEGIYVFFGTYTDVVPGDKVQISGAVKEYYPGGEGENNLSITEINLDKLKILSPNNSIPDAVFVGDGGREIPDEIVDDDAFSTFDVVNDGLDFFESLESMIVGVKSGIVVGPRNQFNEVILIPQDLYSRNLISRNGALIDKENDPNPERIILNMNSTNNSQVNIGATLLSPISGILDYSYGNYKINTFGKVSFSEEYPEDTASGVPGEILTIGSYNVENLSRSGEDSKFRAIARNIVNDLNSPVIMVLHEIMDDSGIEDDGEVSASLTITKLLDFIDRAGGPAYGFIDNPPENNQDGGIDGGNIRSVILYRLDMGVNVVKMTNNYLIKNNPMRIGISSREFLGVRKPFVCLFTQAEAQFLIIAVHLTSRGADSPIFGSVQPISKPEENKRNLQAAYINQFAEEISSRFVDLPIIIAGDMNDDPWSGTVKALEGASFTNLAKNLPENEQYSYIFDGNAILLDYILVSDRPDREGDFFTIRHINTWFDHVNQVSDHDAVLAGIDINVK